MIKNSFIRGAVKQMLLIVRDIDVELWAIGLFFISNLVIGQDKIYLIAIFALLIILYKINKNFMESLWITFLAALPFGRGRFFDLVVIPKASWGGNWNLTFQPTLLFSDILLFLIIYILITRYNKYRRSLPLVQNNIAIYVYLFVFALAAGIATYFSQFPLTSLYYYLQLIKLLLIFFVANILLNSKKVVNITIKILILFVFVNAVLVIGQYVNRGPLGLRIEQASTTYLYADENPGIYRPGGFSIDPNVTATMFATLMPILLINLASKKKSLRNINWLIMGSVVVALILTGSRSAWVITTIISYFVLWYLLVKKKLQIYIPMFIKRYWFVFLVLLLIILGTNITGRISSLFGIFSKEGGGTYRLAHLNIGWHYLISSPFGIGIGAFPFRMAFDFPVVNTGLIPNMAHNIFAEVGAETGILGLGSFIVSLWLIFRTKYNNFEKKYNLQNLGILIAFASMFILSNFFPWFIHPRVDWLFWILAAHGLSNKSIVE